MKPFEILSGIKSKDADAVLRLSELALREKKEAYIPVLFHCLEFCNDPLLKRNLLRLMSVFHQKYTPQLRKFTNDDNMEVRNLSLAIIESIQVSPPGLEDQQPADPLEETAANRLHNVLKKDSLNDLHDLILKYREALNGWNEVQRQEMIDFIMPRCFGLRSSLNERYKPPLLELLVELEPPEAHQDYLALLKHHNFDMFRWGVRGLGNHHSELLSEEWYKFIESYQGSVAQRNLLKMYLEASRAIPRMHREWLNEVMEKFEDDKVLIREIGEAYKWQENDTVPILLTWFNQVKNEDLKFRIIRSLDALLKVEDIQFLRNAIDITTGERERQILSNLLLPLELKIQKSNKKGILKKSHSIKAKTKFNLSESKGVTLTLTVTSIFVCLTILFINKASLIRENNQPYQPAIKTEFSKIMLEQCNAEIINLDPLRLLCKGYIIGVTNINTDWQSHWLGEIVKIKLSKVKVRTKQSSDISADVILLNEVDKGIELPRIGYIKR